jgi:peptidoglycan biosynthesis protein MviN/MurJ (putative lipid II flippase)
MVVRLLWLAQRKRRFSQAPAEAAGSELPRASFWFWAIASAGLPLALPFAARSLASDQGPGALATFNYAWKMVELPLLLAVQLVATLALGPISQAMARAASRDEAAAVVRRGFALAWTLACASAAGLLVASPAVAQLLFGWGRMDATALANVAEWGRIGAWGLLPQALTAIALAVLAAQGRMQAAVLAYGGALLLLLRFGRADGAALMEALNFAWTGVAAAALLAVGSGLRGWLPGRALLAPLAGLSLLEFVLHLTGLPRSLPLQFALGAAAAMALMGLAWWASPDLRAALRR